MELEHALRQIGDIRRQMAHAETFRGYRSAVVAFSGVAAVTVAALQGRLVPSPALELGSYIALWAGLAMTMAALAGADLARRTWRATSLDRARTVAAVSQMTPSLGVGALLTMCIAVAAPQVGWMLPGLWALLYGLGLMSSARLLPQPSGFVALHYIACGCGCLVWGQGANAFSPWLMGVTFGGGQLLGAAVLYWTLERPHAAATDE